MQFHIYDPSKDTLKVGTTIKLGGREGVIGEEEDLRNRYKVTWLGLSGIFSNTLNLNLFPLLEIGEEELTITKRLKEEMQNRVAKVKAFDQVQNYNREVSEFFSWIGSLKEVD